ncbi:MAG TPA: proprotein convertase P-domain-containing protein [Polyangiales bacterium]
MTFIPTTASPFASLAAFTGKSPNGNWTIRVHDNNTSGFGNPAPRISSWGIQVCVDPN